MGWDMKKGQRETFIKGAMILTFAGILSRGIGALYRIPLNRMAGPETMALYQMAYPLYTMALALSTAGIPVAVAKLVSEHRARGDANGAFNTVRVALIVLGILSGIVTAIIILLSPYYGKYIAKTTDSVLPVMAISPAIFFVSVMAVYRGYFQGIQNMTPYALSQILEQVVRVITALCALFFLGQNEVIIASIITLGPSTGSLIGLIYISCIFNREKKRLMEEGLLLKPKANLSVFWDIMYLAYPIILGSLIIPAMNMVDVAVTNGQLLKIPGMTEQNMKMLFGYLTSYAGTLIHIPTVITIGVAVTLVPAISHSIAVNNWIDVKGKILSSFKFTSLIAFPSAFGLIALAVPINLLLFNDAKGAIPLRVLALAIPFITLNQTATSILHGMGKTFVPVRNMIIAVTIKLIVNYLLTPIPAINIQGAAMGTVAGFASASLLNTLTIIKNTGVKIPLDKSIFKPALASALMGITVTLAFRLFSFYFGNGISTFLTIVLGMVVYLAMVILFKIVTREEIKSLPYLRKLIRE